MALKYSLKLLCRSTVVLFLGKLTNHEVGSITYMGGKRLK